MLPIHDLRQQKVKLVHVNGLKRYEKQYANSYCRKAERAVWAASTVLTVDNQLSVKWFGYDA
jgi:hypothetical protein